MKVEEKDVGSGSSSETRYNNAASEESDGHGLLQLALHDGPPTGKTHTYEGCRVKQLHIDICRTLRMHAYIMVVTSLRACVHVTLVDMCTCAL